jgi:hypothetical protein
MAAGAAGWRSPVEDGDAAADLVSAFGLSGAVEVSGAGGVGGGLVFFDFDFLRGLAEVATG